MRTIKLIFTTLAFGLFVVTTANAQTEAKATTTEKKACCKAGEKTACKGKKGKACCKKAKKGKKCEHASASKECTSKSTTSAAKDDTVVPTKTTTEKQVDKKEAVNPDEELSPKGGPTRRIAITEEGVPVSSGSKERTIKGTSGSNPK